MYKLNVSSYKNWLLNEALELQEGIKIAQESGNASEDDMGVYQYAIDTLTQCSELLGAIAAGVRSGNMQEGFANGVMQIVSTVQNIYSYYEQLNLSVEGQGYQNRVIMATEALLVNEALYFLLEKYKKGEDYKDYAAKFSFGGTAAEVIQAMAFALENGFDSAVEETFVPQVESTAGLEETKVEEAAPPWVEEPAVVEEVVNPVVEEKKEEVVSSGELSFADIINNLK